MVASTEDSSRILKSYKFLRLATFGLAGLLIGCEVGPNYTPPKTDVKTQFSELAHTPPSTQPSKVNQQPLAAKTKWWTDFGDAELNRLVDRAMRGSLTLQEAQSRLVEARYEETIAGAQLYPEINADGGYNHARGSKNVVIPAGAFGNAGGKSSAALARPGPRLAPASAGGSSGGGGGASGSSIAGPESALGQGGLPNVVTDVYQVGFDASWEIDVFGGERRNVEAAQADAEAAREDLRDVQVSLAAEVARNYVQLRGYQQQAVIARSNLSLQEDTLELTRSKYQNGFVTELDVARQTALVATTAATIPPLEYQEHQAAHSLGILLGEDPDSLAGELSQGNGLPPVPPTVPVGLPSDLLRRRPDIRRAERQLAASTALVGAATADLYPKFTITGLVGLDSTKPKNLFDYSSHYYNIVPGVSWPIFNAGQIQANIDVQNEQQKQALLNYRQTVLTALKDVEDALAAYRTEQLRRRALTDAVSASKEAADLARQQYQQGVVDFLTVLDAQRDLLSAQDQLVQSQSAVSGDLVALYKALGGGWN